MEITKIRETLAQGESLTVEFKSDRGKLPDRDLVAAVACLANGHGGTLFLGVEDDGTVTGLSPERPTPHATTLLEALVSNRTVPPLSCSATVIEIDDTLIAAITVPSARTPVGTSDGTYTRRALRNDGQPQCLPYAFHEMFSHAVEVGQFDHARLPVQSARRNDLDPLEIARARNLARTAGDTILGDLSDDDLLRALAALTPSGEITVGALLLFGHEESLQRLVPTHETLLHVLRHHQVAVNVRSRRPLLATAHDLNERLASHNTEQEIASGLVRVAIPLFSPIAVRELVANALVHRDYTRLGAIQVRLDDTSLTISSPGGFPSGITTSNYLHETHARSPLLADAFRRTGLVERSGRGIARTITETVRLGRHAPDYSRSSPDRVVASLGLGRSDLELVTLITERERATGAPLGLATLQILSSLRENGALTLAETADLLQLSEGAARAALQRVAADGLIETRGSGRSTAYHLSALVYRALDEPSGYIRVHGLSDARRESMVLDYVEAHGKITRAEAAELCGLSSPQASTLLRRLREAGRLEMVGTKRTAYYTAPRTTAG